MPGGVAADRVATVALTGTVSAPERETVSLASVSLTVVVPACALIIPGGERGSQPSVIPTCGSAVATVTSAASTTRSSVIPPIVYMLKVLLLSHFLLVRHFHVSVYKFMRYRSATTIVLL